MSELNASEAVMAGQAARIPAALKASSAVITATIQVTRAETGKVEEYTLQMTPLDDQQEQQKEAE